MRRPASGLGTVLLIGTLLAASAAQAVVVISSDPTQNMSCVGGVCTPTASDAVLNADDLTGMLAHHDTTVSTTGSGVEAGDIRITARVRSENSFQLTLGAQGSIVFASHVVVLGNGNVSLASATRNGGPSLFFLNGASLTFVDPSGVLSINGARYRLETTLTELARAVVAHPRRAYALAVDYDSRPDGVYATSPIAIPFTGRFTGLGHRISGLTIADTANASVGLFSTTMPKAWVGNIRIVNIAAYGNGAVGGLIGLNQGSVTNSSATGIVRGGDVVGELVLVGGLVGHNSGDLTDCWADGRVSHGYAAGGLVGENDGTIHSSFAAGSVTGPYYNGGLAGWNVGNFNGITGSIRNSYATASVKGRPENDSQPLVGGLVGNNGGYKHDRSKVATSYSTGTVSGPPPYIGGSLGVQKGAAMDTYWDTTTSGTAQAVGYGDDTGITGLTTTELQSALPAGFDPAIWGQDPSVNSGYPYLLANPPQ